MIPGVNLWNCIGFIHTIGGKPTMLEKQSANSTSALWSGLFASLHATDLLFYVLCFVVTPGVHNYYC